MYQMQGINRINHYTLVSYYLNATQFSPIPNPTRWYTIIPSKSVTDNNIKKTKMSNWNKWLRYLWILVMDFVLDYFLSIHKSMLARYRINVYGWTLSVDLYKSNWICFAFYWNSVVGNRNTISIVRLFCKKISYKRVIPYMSTEQGTSGEDTTFDDYYQCLFQWLRVYFRHPRLYVKIQLNDMLNN